MILGYSNNIFFETRWELLFKFTKSQGFTKLRLNELDLKFLKTLWQTLSLSFKNFFMQGLSRSFLIIFIKLFKVKVKLLNHSFLRRIFYSLLKTKNSLSFSLKIIKIEPRSFRVLTEVWNLAVVKLLKKVWLQAQAQI